MSCYNSPMIFYGDESGIDGNSKYIYVGGILSDEPLTKNIIKSELNKKFKKLPIRTEYKYSDRGLDQKIKDKIIKNLNKKFKIVTKNKKYSKLNIADSLSRLLAQIVDDYGLNGSNDVFEIIYDKTKHLINEESISKYIKSDIKFKFKMIDSKNSYGVQCSDWVVGDARYKIEKYKTENSQK